MASRDETALCTKVHKPRTRMIGFVSWLIQLSCMWSRDLILTSPGSPISLPVPTSGFQLQQGGKPSASASELLWWPFFHHLTSLHHQDPIGVLGRGQAMGHSEHCAAAAHDRRTDGGSNGGLASAIDRGRSLVQQQHGRVPHQGPSEGEQLALSGGELHAPAQQRVIPLGQRLDEG